MDPQDSLLCISTSHADADNVIRSLSRSGLDVTKLSLVGTGYHSEEHPIGFYSAGDRIASWGGTGALWGGIWGLLVAPAAFVLPGLGLVAIAGPIVAALFGALEGAIIVGGVSALGAALSMIGVPKDVIVKYEIAMKANRYALMLHGDAAEVAKARAVLKATPALRLGPLSSRPSMIAGCASSEPTVARP